MNGFTEHFAWLEDALELAVCAGGCAALLAMAVLAINILFRRWLSARQMGLLWSLVLVRLVLPAAPISPVSLQNLLPPLPDEADGTKDALAPIGVGYYSAASDPQPRSAAAASPYSTGITDAAPASEIASIEDWVALMLPLIWFLGAVAVLLRTIIVHWRFSLCVKQVAPTHYKHLLSVWTSCCQAAGTREGIPVVLFDGVDQPAVTGLFQPTLLLPPHVTELEEQQLRMVMLHELAHVRRRHIAANWLLVVVRAVHWWNPVYWLAAARYRSLREQACDAFALERIEGLPPRHYGELLLILASRPSTRAWRIRLPASMLGFLSSFFRKRAVHNRLKALRTAGVKRGRWHTAAVGALVVLAVAGGFTDAGNAGAPLVHRYPQQPQVDLDWRHWEAVPEADREPLVTHVYDVESITARVAANERSDNATMMLKSILTQAVAQLEGRPHLPIDGARPDSEGPSERVVFDGTTLSVTATPHAHAEIFRYLEAWRQSGLAQICVETRMITSARDIASAVGISWKYLEAFSAESAEEPPAEIANGKPVVRAKSAVEDYLPLTVASLSEEQTAALLQAAQEAVLFIHAPKVTLFNGQRATVLDRTQTPFVVGIRDDDTPFAVGIGDEGKGTGQPKIVVIDEGTKLTLRTVLSPDAASVRLDANIELSQISDVETVSTLFHGKSKTIQIPRVKRCRIDVASLVPDQHSLLIGCIPSYEQKEFFYVLLTVRNLRLPADGGE